MESIFQFSKGEGYFITDINIPGNYNPETGLISGYLHDNNGECIQLTAVAYSKLVPAVNIPDCIRHNGEVVKQTITSKQNECRVYIVFKDGGLKILDPVTDEQSAYVIYLYAEDMQEIIAAINS